MKGEKDKDKYGQEKEPRGRRKQELAGNPELEGDMEGELGRMFAKMSKIKHIEEERTALNSKDGKAQGRWLAG